MCCVILNIGLTFKIIQLEGCRKLLQTNIGKS